MTWLMYHVNGYKFHTTKWGRVKTTNNTGVCAKVDIEGGESDQHGVVNEILELEYSGKPLKKVVLFNCKWYDPTRHHKIIDINHTKRYEKFDPFIIAQNVRHVYYLPYPGRCKSYWRVVIKCKPRGRVEVEEVSKQAY